VLWRRKHLLGIGELEKRELEALLDLALHFKKKGFDREPLNATVANLFYEASTRTANSFALAARKVGLACLNFSRGSSSVSKGETLIDTAKNIEAMGVSGFVIRHSAPGAARLLARNVEGAVANGGDGRHEHPTQCLLDLATIIEHKGAVEGVKVAILGDIAHSRVARSLMQGLLMLGAQVAVTGPSTMMPKHLPGGVTRLGGIDEALEGRDVLYFLRVQLERQGRALIPSLREYHEFYGLCEKRLERVGDDVLIMHPGPVNRGVELSAAAADAPQSVILSQVTNGVFVRMAVLYLAVSAALGMEVEVG
jgi:aspartate carbamoyltransferase catalytic subunit